MNDHSKPTGRGNTEQFDKLHGLLVTTIERELERCLQAGEAPSPAFLAQARQLLSDNSVTVPAESRRYDRLKDLMPDFDALERDGNVLPFGKAKE